MFLLSSLHRQPVRRPGNSESTHTASQSETCMTAPWFAGDQLLRLYYQVVGSSRLTLSAAQEGSSNKCSQFLNNAVHFHSDWKCTLLIASKCCRCYRGFHSTEPPSVSARGSTAGSRAVHRGGCAGTRLFSLVGY